MKTLLRNVELSLVLSPDGHEAVAVHELKGFGGNPKLNGKKIVCLCDICIAQALNEILEEQTAEAVGPTTALVAQIIRAEIVRTIRGETDRRVYQMIDGCWHPIEGGRDVPPPKWINVGYFTE